MFMNNKKIILASASPRRNQLLKMLGLDFKAIKPYTSEIFDKRFTIDDNLKIITKNKANYVLRTHHTLDSLIIAADTVVLFDNTILTKPSNSAEAYNMLKSLSGNLHKVITGVYVLDSSSGKEIYKSKTTTVKFRSLSNDEIKTYISSGEAYDKAGSYAIQGLGSLFVESIEGCYYNVVGLPLALLYDILKEFNISIL